MFRDIQNVLIVGSGVMGRGVLNTFSEGGFDCTVLSRNPSRVHGLPAGTRVVGQPPSDPPDLVIENVPENLEIKQQIFQALDAAYGGEGVR